MKATINKTALDEFMPKKEMADIVAQILQIQFDLHGDHSGPQYGSEFVHKLGYTVYVEAWTDREIQYSKKTGKIKKVIHTIHSLRVSNKDRFNRQITLFEKFTTDETGGIRQDRKTETEVA